MSLKKALMAKERPTAEFPIQVKDPSKYQAQVTRFHAQLRVFSEAGKDVGEINKKLKNAERALKRCYKVLNLRALAPPDFESLVYLHPPTVSQVEGKSIEDVPLWNDDTFRPALIAATAYDADMSAEEWASVISEGMSEGEFKALWSTVLSLNTLPRSVSGAVPKEFEQTPL